MNVVEVLKKARAKISGPEAWTQRAYARSGNGSSMGARDVFAVCWCATGAIIAVSDSMAGEAFCVLRKTIQEDAVFDSLIVEFNDAKGRTQDEVLAMFDKAIAKAEEMVNE